VELEPGCWWVRIGAMPAVPRRPGAQRERERLQSRRLRAAELFAAKIHQAEVARQLGVPTQVVSVWHAHSQSGGPPRAAQPGVHFVLDDGADHSN